MPPLISRKHFTAFSRLLAGLASAALSVATIGCGSGGEATAPADLAPPPPDLVLADLNSPGYPAGATGPNLDDVVPNFTFRGYFSPSRTTGLASTETYGTVSFDTLRTSGARFAILQTAAFW